MVDQPWSEYGLRVADIEKKGWSFTHVCHISHLKAARRIFEDGRLTSSLVFDEPTLNKSRTRVLWISPNVYQGGSYFGNISFSIAWSHLLEGKELYWIGKVPLRTAVRLLLTDRDFSKEFTLYDPTTECGPLLLHDGKWYYGNGPFVEILFEANFKLSDCDKVSFVDHHNGFCAKQSNCKWIGLGKQKAGAILIARLLGNEMLRDPNLFHSGEGIDLRLNDDAKGSWQMLLFALLRSSNEGPVNYGDELSAPLMRAIFHAYGRNCEKEALQLCKLFKSPADLRSAARKTAVDAFKVTNTRALTFLDDDEDE